MTPGSCFPCCQASYINLWTLLWLPGLQLGSIKNWAGYNALLERLFNAIDIFASVMERAINDSVHEPLGIISSAGICFSNFKLKKAAEKYQTLQLLPLNSLWPNDPIWRHRSGSTLAQVMACCLTAPSHYLNQCWFTISKVHWYSFQYYFTRDASAINH